MRRLILDVVNACSVCSPSLSFRIFKGTFGFANVVRIVYFCGLKKHTLWILIGCDYPFIIPITLYIGLLDKCNLDFRITEE